MPVCETPRGRQSRPSCGVGAGQRRRRRTLRPPPHLRAPTPFRRAQERHSRPCGTASKQGIDASTPRFYLRPRSTGEGGPRQRPSRRASQPRGPSAGSSNGRVDDSTTSAPPRPSKVQAGGGGEVRLTMTGRGRNRGSTPAGGSSRATITRHPTSPWYLTPGPASNKASKMLNCREKVKFPRRCGPPKEGSPGGA